MLQETDCHLAFEQVVDAMRQTIANYLGGLPPPFFTVEISAKGEDLAQLMYTMMVTGYVFRNVQYKLDLRTNMLPQGQFTLPACVWQQALLQSCPYPALVTSHLHPTWAHCCIFLVSAKYA